MEKVKNKLPNESQKGARGKKKRWGALENVGTPKGVAGFAGPTAQSVFDNEC